MKHLRLNALIISAFLVPNLAAAADGCSKARVIGIRNTGTSCDGSYLNASQRALLSTAKKAGNKGFTPIADLQEPSAATGYSFSLSGAEEVPPVTTAASGSCLAVLNAAKDSLTVKCTHTAASPTMAHIHQAPAGQDGGVVCDLGAAASPIEATCALTSALLDALEDDQLYVNVHTTANSGGELRGQLVN